MHDIQCLLQPLIPLGLGREIREEELKLAQFVRVEARTE